MKDCNAKHFQSKNYTACWCLGCEQVKVRCGNVSLPFKHQQIERFWGFLKDMQKQQITQKQKCDVQFKFSELSFSFSEAELEDLIDLLGMIKVEIQREQLEAIFRTENRRVA